MKGFLVEDKKLKQLKEIVYEANMKLHRSNLVLFTWGNVSEVDRERQLIAIKPSGVEYDKLVPEDIVLVGLDGKTIYSNLKPSADTKTHLRLYNAFPDIGGITHTHSKYATSFAQAHSPIDCFGTTHADFFLGQVPCTDFISDKSLNKDYEDETGILIVETLEKKNIDVKNIKACLVAGHGPFVWGQTADDSVDMSIVLEEVAHKSLITLLINPSTAPLKQTLLEKHFYRKHGKNAYYGQKGAN